MTTWAGMWMIASCAGTGPNGVALSQTRLSMAFLSDSVAAHGKSIKHSTGMTVHPRATRAG